MPRGVQPSGRSFHLLEPGNLSEQPEPPLNWRSDHRVRSCASLGLPKKGYPQIDPHSRAMDVPRGPTGKAPIQTKSDQMKLR